MPPPPPAEEGPPMSELEELQLKANETVDEVSLEITDLLLVII